MHTPIIIVGAGAAGIGMGVILKRLRLPFVILEAKSVGASFKQWCAQTRFISPSFTGNGFGAVDLNAITPDTSPAYSLCSEHPTGKMYARYLSDVAEHFKLPICDGVRVHRIEHHPLSGFYLQTSQGDVSCDYLIWAAGEYQYPKRNGFKGAPHCWHYSEIEDWATLKGEHFTVIGGYESGVDAAYQLAKLGKTVTLFDGSSQLQRHGSDSSYTLSPFTRERFSQVRTKIQVINERIESVDLTADGYELIDTNFERHTSLTTPIDCTGFTSSLRLIQNLFEFKTGNILLTDCDESTCCPNLFLTGPQVRHHQAIFCFIYKFRQRFAVIAETLSQRLEADSDLCAEVIDYYRQRQFYLKNLSCCDEECTC